jgi:hypothetical protein
MNWFQIFAVAVVVVALVYLIGRFLTRERECTQCKSLSSRDVDWNREEDEDVEEEDESESDIED